jgi:hypothetical protein
MPQMLSYGLKKKEIEMNKMVKRSIKLIGISSFILLLLVLPSLSMAEMVLMDNDEILILNDDGTGYYANDDGFVFAPGYMRIKFGGGYLEIWVWDGFRWWLPNGNLFVDGYFPGQ